MSLVPNYLHVTNNNENCETDETLLLLSDDDFDFEKSGSGKTKRDPSDAAAETVRSYVPKTTYLSRPVHWRLY